MLEFPNHSIGILCPLIHKRDVEVGNSVVLECINVRQDMREFDHCESVVQNNFIGEVDVAWTQLELTQTPAD